MEEEIRIVDRPPAIRSAYLKAIHTLIETSRVLCPRSMDYSLVETSIGQVGVGALLEMEGEV